MEREEERERRIYCGLQISVCGLKRGRPPPGGGILFIPQSAIRKGSFSSSPFRLLRLRVDLAESAPV